MNLRRGGYQGRIISFEPGCKAFDALQKNARGDSLWICHKLALGDQDGELVLQIAEASEFSSFLPLTEWVLESDPNAQTRTEERVPVATLDTFWPTYNLGQSRVLLKLDTQGFERQILLGAARSLEHITGIQLELSLRTAYVGQPMIEEMLPLLRTLGFELFAVYEGFRQSNSTRLIELDGLFFRSC
jgi:FkbM family methyltransferase